MLSRQQVAFRKECRKIKGLGSLREDFYTRFMPENDGFWAVTWSVKDMVKYDLVNRT